MKVNEDLENAWVVMADWMKPSKVNLGHSQRSCEIQVGMKHLVMPGLV